MKTFGDWTVLSDENTGTAAFPKWLCTCKCGKNRNVSINNLRRGLTKSCGKCSQVIVGFGINDMGYVVSGDPIYFTWKRMIERCYSKRDPTYEDKFVSERWKLASRFKSWMSGQPWQGMELDKDLLVLGNKEYGPDFCNFIPKQVNLALSLGGSSGSGLPLGVCLHNEGPNPYLCRSAKKYLGIFPCPEAAHKKWQEDKAGNLVKVVDWWAGDAKVKHTFHPVIASNLISISNKLLHDIKIGAETKFLLP